MVGTWLRLEPVSTARRRTCRVSTPSSRVSSPTSSTLSSPASPDSAERRATGSRNELPNITKPDTLESPRSVQLYGRSLPVMEPITLLPALWIASAAARFMQTRRVLSSSTSFVVPSTCQLNRRAYRSRLPSRTMSIVVVSVVPVTVTLTPPTEAISSISRSRTTYGSSLRLSGAGRPDAVSVTGSPSSTEDPVPQPLTEAASSTMTASVRLTAAGYAAAPTRRGRARRPSRGSGSRRARGSGSRRGGRRARPARRGARAPRCRTARRSRP